MTDQACEQRRRQPVRSFIRGGSRTPHPAGGLAAVPTGSPSGTTRYPGSEDVRLDTDAGRRLGDCRYRQGPTAPPHAGTGSDIGAEPTPPLGQGHEFRQGTSYIPNPMTGLGISASRRRSTPSERSANELLRPTRVTHRPLRIYATEYLMCGRSAGDFPALSAAKGTTTSCPVNLTIGGTACQE